MSGVTTSSLSLAWSLRNWVILDYEEPNGLTVRPWAPFLLSCSSSTTPFLFQVWTVGHGLLLIGPPNGFCGLLRLTADIFRFIFLFSLSLFYSIITVVCLKTRRRWPPLSSWFCGSTLWLLSYEWSVSFLGLFQSPNYLPVLGFNLQHETYPSRH